MAKGSGLIGNFKGKVGNTVGYKLTASNNGQTQGIRVYQPIVKNPRTAAQAEQRAKLLAVNATYRALKMVIDRGNESLPYGNKSRLAWLKTALKSEQMPWYEKGSLVRFPVGCQLTKGSLPSIFYSPENDYIAITAEGVTAATNLGTIGAVSTALKAAYPFLKDGDQITFVSIDTDSNVLNADVQSIIIDATSAVVTDKFAPAEDAIHFTGATAALCGSIIVSRLGENGEHLRSNELIVVPANMIGIAPYNADSKAAAIASYQSSGYVNADWQEDSVQ